MATEVMTEPEGRIIHKTYAVLSGAAIPQRVHVTQYDESLPVIACTLYKDGQLYTIPDGASVRMRMNKNGLPVYHEAMGIDDARHVVYLEITAQMTVLYGEFAMVIEVETSDGKTAGTSYLRLIVRQNPVQNPELDNIPDYTANSNRLTAEGVKKLQDESSTQQKAIEDKGKNTLESIPADYSTLSGKVDKNTSGISQLKEDLEQITQSGTGTGLTLEQINLFDTMFDHIYYIDDAGGTIAGELIASLKASLPVTLVSISATYSGGYVTEGTNVNDLTDIVVTATYSDDSTKEVTEYTLSGTIVAGNNTITVTYKGLTTTFIVKGTEIEQDGLHPFENGTWSSANGNTVTISDGRHVVINKTYSENLWMSLTQCSKTSNLITYASLYNGIGTNYTIPASANVLLKIYNIENNNGLSFRVGANKQSYFSFQATDLDMEAGVFTDEISLNATFGEETNIAGIFCNVAKNSLGTLSFDVNLTVNGERWV